MPKSIEQADMDDAAEAYLAKACEATTQSFPEMSADERLKIATATAINDLLRACGREMCGGDEAKHVAKANEIIKAHTAILITVVGRAVMAFVPAINRDRLMKEFARAAMRVGDRFNG